MGAPRNFRRSLGKQPIWSPGWGIMCLGRWCWSWWMGHSEGWRKTWGLGLLKLEIGKGPGMGSLHGLLASMVCCWSQGVCPRAPREGGRSTCCWPTLPSWGHGQWLDKKGLVFCKAIYKLIILTQGVLNNLC